MSDHLYAVDPLDPLTTSWEREERLEPLKVKLTPDAPSAPKGNASPAADKSARGNRVYKIAGSHADISLLKFLAPDRPDIATEAGGSVLNCRDSNSPTEDPAEADAREREQANPEQEEAEKLRVTTLGTKSLGLLPDGVEFDTTPSLKDPEPARKPATEEAAERLRATTLGTKSLSLRSDGVEFDTTPSLRDPEPARKPARETPASEAMTSVLQSPKPHDFLQRANLHGPSMRPNTPSKAHTHPPHSGPLKLDTPAAAPQRKPSWEPWPPDSLATSPVSMHMKSPSNSHYNKLPAIQSAAATPAYAGPASPDGAGGQHQNKLPSLHQVIGSYNDYGTAGSRVNNRSNSITRFRQDSFPRPGSSYPSPYNYGSPDTHATSPRDFAHHHQSPLPHPSLPPPSNASTPATYPATYPTPPSGHHFGSSAVTGRRASQPPESPLPLSHQVPPLSATSATFTAVTDPHTSPETYVFSPDAGNTTATAMTTPSGSMSMPTPSGSVFGGGSVDAARTPLLPLPQTPISAAPSPAASALPPGGGAGGAPASSGASLVPTHRNPHPHLVPHTHPSDAMMPSPPHPDGMVLSPPGSSGSGRSVHHRHHSHSHDARHGRPARSGSGGSGFADARLQLPHPDAMVVSPADGKNVQIMPKGPYPPEQPGSAAGPDGAGSSGNVPPTLFRCTYAGCRALPFNTQYLLKSVPPSPL
jgi:hypothetical protein